jgi:hypothetical protein
MLLDIQHQRGLNTKRPTNVFFWVPRNLSHRMDRQARTSDAVQVKSREMTSRTHTLPWWLGVEEVKTIESCTTAVNNSKVGSHSPQPQKVHSSKSAHIARHHVGNVLCVSPYLYLGLEQGPQPQSWPTWSIPTWGMYSVTLSVCTWAWSRVNSRKVGPPGPSQEGNVLCDPICLYLGLEQGQQPQSRPTWSIPRGECTL